MSPALQEVSWIDKVSVWLWFAFYTRTQKIKTKILIMLEEGQVFVTTFDKTHSRNMPFISNVLFFLVVAFYMGYIW